MDPTKSFDHLDPKLKETYARVMGTDTNSTGDTANPAPADPTLSAMPSPLDSAQPTADTGPNPGTGPTVSTLPTDSSMLSTPMAATSEPTPDPSAPSTASFFSNPSPATADPTQAADVNAINLPDPAGNNAPVAAYTPEVFNASPGVAAISSEQMAQPLPSPSTVNQQGQHQTSALLKVIYIILAVIFFSIYTIFWIKVFNLPFLF